MSPRRYDEPIEVKAGLVAGRRRTGPLPLAQPALVRPRDREPLARDRRVVGWPRCPRRPREMIVDARDDRSGEHEIWRVVAAPGRSGQHGVCELAYASSTGHWRLRTLLD